MLQKTNTPQLHLAFLKPFLIALLLLCFGNSFAQEFQGREAQEIIPGTEKVVIDPENGLVRLAIFEESGQSVQRKETAKWLAEILRIQDTEFIETELFHDQLGYEHVRYRQTIQGVPVEGTAVTIHRLNGEVMSLSGDYYKSIRVENLSPNLMSSQAISIAKNSTAAREFFENEEIISPSLVILPINNNHRLAYKTDVFSSKPFDRNWIYVDANTGEILKTVTRIQNSDIEGIAETKYSGTRLIVTDSVAPDSFRLVDNTRGDGIITKDINGSLSFGVSTHIYDSDNFWEHDTYSNEGALDAHWGAATTYDYYLEVHNRDSYSGNGNAIRSYVDFYSSNNAFWSGNRIYYGDGGNGNPYTTLDICAHEFTHGVIVYSADLEYEYESGALNESFCDIFSTAVSFYAYGDSANYSLGEGIGATPIRSMSDPKLYDQPNTYQGEYWESGTADNGGVHVNSGVQNYWFYLLCEGGSGENDLYDNYEIESIGLDAAADIAYRSLTVYLSMSSDYADARLYSIQAAIDLYGPCSHEVIQVTNAWHAVGVGDQFDNEVIADFNSAYTYSCQVPGTFEFSNLSVNATSWQWDFGDGETSTEENPVHTYEESAVNDVTLIAYGEGQCEMIDTLQLESFINVESVGQPAEATCQPTSVSPSNIRGVNVFQLGDISNSTIGLNEGYQEYLCDFSTELIEGNSYHLSVNTGSTDYCWVWIDIDNDGSFSVEELVYSGEAQSQHEADIIIPEGNLYQTPLRLRVYADLFPPEDACSPPKNGNIEDYQIKIIENFNAPEAHFDADTMIEAGETLVFNDLSLNLPDSWQWYFEGGSISNSTDQDPEVTFNEVGEYDVSLIVQNEHGTDTLAVSDYITVVESLNLCDTNTTTAAYGELFDSGGPNEGYLLSEDECTLLISPGCNESITINFHAFNTKIDYDTLKIYDGTSENAPLLLSASGWEIPESVTATSGSVFIKFTVTGYNSYEGWHLTWETDISTELPTTIFAISDSTPPLGEEVQFIDQSTQFPEERNWDFGDGTISTIQSPVHSFEASGSYQVTLSTTNCYGTTSSSQEVIVQDPPSFSMIQDTLHAEISCGSVVEEMLAITNNGSGDLVADFSGSISSSTFSITALTSSNFAFNNNDGATFFFNTLDEANIEYELQISLAETVDELEQDLADTDLLFIPSSNGNDSLLYTSISPALINYVENGGKIFFTGTKNLNQTGLISGSYKERRTLLSHKYNLEPDHPIMSGVPESFPGSDWYFSFYDFEGESAIINLSNIVGNPDYHAMALKFIGLGQVFFTGDNFQYPTEFSDQIIVNAFEYLMDPQPHWINTSDSSIIVPGNSTIDVAVELDPEYYYPGEYYFQGFIETNDPNNPINEIVYHLEISQSAQIHVEEEEVDFEDVYAGFNTSETITVENIGCDTLNLGLSATTPAFSPSISNVDIAPYSTEEITIQFNPQSSGEHNGTLLLSSNGGNDSIGLLGYALTSAQLSVIPADTVHLITSCSSTVDTTITIYNTGSEELFINPDQASNTTPSVVPKVLMMTSNTADIYVENTIEAINQHFTSYELTETDLYTEGPLEEIIHNYDILVIPYQSTMEYYQADYFGPLVEEFVEAGGKVVACESRFLYDFGFGFSAFSNLNTLLHLPSMSEHPIMDGVDSPFSQDDGYAYNFTDENITSLVNVSSHLNYSSVAIKEFDDNGQFIYIGYPFGNIDEAPSRILGQSVEYLAQTVVPDWMNGAPVSSPTTLYPGDSLVIDVEFNGVNQLAGDYYYNTLLNTNDPENDSLNIVFHLEIIGQSLLAIETEELHFDSTITGSNNQETLIITNEGCDSLLMDLSIDDENFSTQETFAIPGYSQDTLVINFAPLSPGTHNGMLEISSNGDSETVALFGEALEVPDVAFTPSDTLHTALTCGTDSLAQFTIYNPGSYDLQITSSEIISDTIVPKVLALITYEYGVDEYESTISAIEEHFTDFQLFELFSDYSSELEANIEGKDILLLPPYPYMPEFSWSYLSPIVIDFVSNGGKVLVCASEDLHLTGLFDEAPSSYVSSSWDLMNIAPAHPALQGVPEIFNRADDTHFYDWSNQEDVTPLVVREDNPDHHIIAQKNIGEGTVIYVGYDFDYFENYNTEIIANTMQYLCKRDQPDWLANVLIDSTTTIAPGDSLVVNVDLNASGMPPGNYYYQTSYLTNSPGNDTLQYVFHLELNSSAVLETETDNIDFGEIMAELSATDTVIIENPGCETLEVTPSLNASGFSFSPSAFTLPPFSHDTLFVTFEPATGGQFPDTLKLNSNVGPKLINLFGEAIDAPNVEISPNIIELDITPCSDSVLVNFELANTGAGILDYSVLRHKGHLPIDSVLSVLNENHNSITSMVPDLFLFEDGESGDYIYDGGNNMYDFGNKINTSHMYSDLLYSGSEIVTNNFFGDTTRYFTAKFPGLFVLTANLNDIDDVEIDGALGPNYQGFRDGTVLTYEHSPGLVFNGFVTRTYETGAPSVNHIFITRDLPGIEQSYSMNTGQDDHRISGLNNNSRIYYLLFSSEDGQYIPDSLMQEIFESFTDLVSTSEGNTSGVIQPDSSNLFSYYIHTSEYESGEYEVPFYFNFNDPDTPQDTLFAQLNVSDDLCSDFNIVNAEGCSGYIYLTDQTINDVDTWQWDFGDGNTSNEQNPNHQYDEPGVYEISLVTCNWTGCDSIAKTTSVESVSDLDDPYCLPELAYNYTNGDYISYIEIGPFLNESGSSPLAYQDFTCGENIELHTNNLYSLFMGDGSQANHFRAKGWVDFNNDNTFSDEELVFATEDHYEDSITFNIPNEFPLFEPMRFRVIVDQAVIQSSCEHIYNGEAEDYTIVLLPPLGSPVANFSLDSLDGCGQYQFTDLSESNPTEWLWEFGDGTTSNEQNPIHTYTLGGTYNVELTVSNVFGSAAYESEVIVPVQGITDIQIVSNPVVGEEVEFEVESDGVANLNWSFGDGTTDVTSNNQNSHIYEEEGAYEVSATTSSIVCSDSMGLAINVISSIISSENLQECGQYQFTDLSQTNPTEWLWDFGDGNTSSEQNPVHTYELGGTYTVQLTITDNFSSSSYTYEVVVPQQGLIEIQNIENPVLGEEIEFEVISDGVTNWTWDLGDGTIEATDSNEYTHIYEEEGMFEIIVTTNDEVCSDSVSSEIEIFVTNVPYTTSGTDLSLFPNPTEQALTLKYSNNLEVEAIKIYDSLGKKISFTSKEISEQEIGINLTEAVPGVYIFTLRTTDGRLFHKRVVVQ